MRSRIAVELPLRIGVLADLSGDRPEAPRPPLGKRDFVTVDRDNLDVFLRSIGPGITVEVPDLAPGPGGGPRAVALRFREFADFGPGRVALQVPALAPLLEERATAAAGRVAEIDRAVSARVAAILTHPAFRRLEAAWRGLSRLVNAAETGATLRVQALDVSREELESDLLGAPGLAGSALFRKVHDDVFGHFLGEPFGLLVGDFEFSDRPEDVDLLARLADLAAAAFAPFIAGAAPRLAGVERWEELLSVRDPARAVGGAGDARWRAFRDTEAARFVGLTMPRVLVRSAYGDSDAAPAFRLDPSATGDTSLWASAAWVYAQWLADSFARHGHTSARPSLVDPLRLLLTGAPEGVVDVCLTERHAAVLPGLGLIPLLATPGASSAAFFNHPSCARPREYDDRAATAAAGLSVQLPVTLAAARLAQYIKAIARDRPGGPPAGAAVIEGELNAWLGGYSAAARGEAASDRSRPFARASARVEPAPGKAGGYRAVVTLGLVEPTLDAPLALRLVIDLPAPAADRPRRSPPHSPPPPAAGAVLPPPRPPRAVEAVPPPPPPPPPLRMRNGGERPAGGEAPPGGRSSLQGKLERVRAPRVRLTYEVDLAEPRPDAVPGVAFAADPAPDLPPAPVPAARSRRRPGGSVLGWLLGGGGALFARARDRGARPRPAAPRAREVAPPEPAGETFRRHTDISFPARVRVGQWCNLRVQLVPADERPDGGTRRERPKPHPHDETLTLTAPTPRAGEPPPPVRVTVSVAAENFEVRGAYRAEVLVPRAGRSPALQFDLRGQAAGPGRVMVDFAQDGRPLGSVDLAPEVVAGSGPLTGAAAPWADALRVDLAGAGGAAPDVVIKVFEHRLAGHPGRLQFVLSSHLPALADLPVCDGDLGTLDLRGDVAEWVEAQLQSLRRLAGRADVTADEVARALADVGWALFEQVLPPSLRDLCWEFRRRGVRSVLVLSDEPHIPWELVKPFRHDPVTGAIVAEDEHWGASYALAHWLRGRPPVPRLRLRSVVAVGAGGPAAEAPDDTTAPPTRDMIARRPAPAGPGPAGDHAPLPALDEELALLGVFMGLGAEVRRVPAHREALRRAIEEGNFHLLHLAGHGDFGGSAAADASVVLLDDGPLTVADLSPRASAALRRDRPLIVFNTCSSGRLGFSLTRVGAWGAHFVRLGCGGFLGTLWPVTDRAALEFARAFYDALAHGVTLGEAARHARLHVRERHPNDPTWLAYRCYADPTATVALEPSGPPAPRP